MIGVVGMKGPKRRGFTRKVPVERGRARSYLMRSVLLRRRARGEAVVKVEPEEPVAEVEEEERDVAQGIAECLADTDKLQVEKDQDVLEGVVERLEKQHQEAQAKKTELFVTLKSLLVKENKAKAKAAAEEKAKRKEEGTDDEPQTPRSVTSYMSQSPRTAGFDRNARPGAYPRPPMQHTPLGPARQQYMKSPRSFQ